MKKNQVPAHFYVLWVVGALFFGSPGRATAEDEKCPGWIPRILGLQFTGIYQTMPTFTSPYTGEKSLIYENGNGRDITRTYGLYLGSQISPNLQAYLDIEMFNGDGLSSGLGLGGYINGDFIRAGSQDLGKAPYPARFFLR
jgi:high affinity Mn2+ porin